MADPTQPRPRRLLKGVLAVSLALNLAVVGLVAGFALREGRSGPPRGVDLTLGPIGQALSREDRRAIGNQLRKDPSLRQGDRRQALAPVIAVIAAQPFDPDALTEALAAAQSRVDRIQVAARDALVARISAMTDAERAAFAEALRKGGSRH